MHAVDLHVLDVDHLQLQRPTLDQNATTLDRNAVDQIQALQLEVSTAGDIEQARHAAAIQSGDFAAPINGCETLRDCEWLSFQTPVNP